MTHDVLSQFFSTLIHLLIFFLLIFSCPVTPTQYIENKRKEKKGETSTYSVLIMYKKPRSFDLDYL